MIIIIKQQRERDGLSNFQDGNPDFERLDFQLIGVKPSTFLREEQINSVTESGQVPPREIRWHHLRVWGGRMQIQLQISQSCGLRYSEHSQSWSPLLPHRPHSVNLQRESGWAKPRASSQALHKSLWYIYLRINRSSHCLLWQRILWTVWCWCLPKEGISFIQPNWLV